MTDGTSNIRILALMKYGRQAASTRQRLLQFRPFLESQGISIEYEPLLSNEYVAGLKNRAKPHYIGLAARYASRAMMLLRRRDFDILWVHKELFPYLGGWAERLAFVPNRPVIYDYDDAIFHIYDRHKSAVVRSLLSRKLQPLMGNAALNLCGNSYLRDYALEFTHKAAVFPTVLDTDYYHPDNKAKEAPMNVVIGWIGSPTTWPYVAPALDALKDATKRHGVTVRIIGAGEIGEEYDGFEFVDWSESTEVRELQRMDIGIMPLPDDPWMLGKCGYKLLQYMACGLPVIASPIGVNPDIVTNGVNGFLAATPEDWSSAIERLVASPELRDELGMAGRKLAVAKYSLSSHGQKLATFIEDVHSNQMSNRVDRQVSA